MSEPTLELKLRRAVRADLPRLLDLLADGTLAASEAEGHPGAFSQAFDTIARDPNQFLLVGEIEGLVIAMAQISFIPGLTRGGAWRANIEAVRVDPAWRNRGLGEQLMGEVVALAKKRGCRLVQLTSHKSRTDAHRFYERLGFARSHEGFKLECE
ncbi:MAG: GNAT family N-acetyltransferase [Burkholderiaceae bacterium]